MKIVTQRIVLAVAVVGLVNWARSIPSMFWHVADERLNVAAPGPESESALNPPNHLDWPAVENEAECVEEVRSVGSDASRRPVDVAVSRAADGAVFDREGGLVFVDFPSRKIFPIKERGVTALSAKRRG